MHLDRADMERVDALGLQLVVAKARPFGNKHFTHRVREIVRAADTDITLDDRALRVTLGEHEVARVDCRSVCSRIGDKKEVNRLLDHRVSRDTDDDTVARHCGIERRKRARLRRRELAQMPLNEIAVGRDLVFERGHGQAGRKHGALDSTHNATVRNDDRVPVLVMIESLDHRRRDVGCNSWRAEDLLRNRSDVGEMPVLILHRREANALERSERIAARLSEPSGLLRYGGRLLKVEAIRFEWRFRCCHLDVRNDCIGDTDDSIDDVIHAAAPGIQS